jgi:ribonuclease J
MESTNASKTGKAPSETEVFVNLENIIKDASGRVIVAAFSSLLTRLYALFEIAKKKNRKINIWKKLTETISIASKQGYIKIPEGLVIKEKDIQKYSDNQLLILCTGSQERDSPRLNRIS